MLDLLDPFLQRLLVISLIHLDFSLRENVACIHTLVDQMHGASSDIHACGYDISVRMGAWEVGQQ